MPICIRHCQRIFASARQVFSPLIPLFEPAVPIVNVVNGHLQFAVGALFPPPLVGENWSPMKFPAVPIPPDPVALYPHRRFRGLAPPVPPPPPAAAHAGDPPETVRT